MRPIGKYIVIKDINESIKTDSGIILSSEDVDRFRYKQASVIAIGTDVIAINNGDKIYYDKSSSFTMLIKDLQYTIILEKDVVVVI